MFKNADAVMKLSQHIAKAMDETKERDVVIHLEALMEVFCTVLLSMREGLADGRKPEEVFDVFMKRYRHIVAIAPADLFE